MQASNKGTRNVYRSVGMPLITVTAHLCRVCPAEGIALPMLVRACVGDGRIGPAGGEEEVSIP